MIQKKPAKKLAKKTVLKVVEPVKVVERIGLDMGCGQNKVNTDYFIQQMQAPVDKVIGIDFVSGEGIDMVHNLTSFPYPFEDNSIDAIFSSHFVEHLDGFERARFMDECYRILKPDGKMRLIHPYYKSVRAVQDFTHKWPPISEASYMYWRKDFREPNKLTHGWYDLKSNFDFNIFYTWQDPTWANKSEEARNFAINHYFNVVADMIVDLVKK